MKKRGLNAGVVLTVRVLNSELQSQAIAGRKSSCPDARCVCAPWAVEEFVQEIQHDSSNLQNPQQKCWQPDS